MSKLKTPQEKKATSLLHDCRNVYRENDKASRKLVPRRKQEGQQHLRRDVKQALNHVASALSEDEIETIEADAKIREIQGNRDRFKKKPDAPLAGILRQRTELYIPDWQGGDAWGPYRERFRKTKSKA